ncbi:MAG TPA: hypothetical protein VMB78_12030 [Dissulfurispiraceae bacterium]|nr:hypothetical protein [Dissulfurispiraceae bacterium]
MSDEKRGAEAPDLICARCAVKMAMGKVTVAYLGSEFPVELFKCPSCGTVFVPEELATGKMLQVEQALEDK